MARRLPHGEKILAVILLIVGVACYLAFSLGSSGGGEYQLQLPKGTYTLESAATARQQAKGLGGMSTLAVHSGMLFDFSKQQNQCFWMKDMHFPLDIIWADSSYRVTHIESRLSPATYPRQYCAVGQYVIELNAGEAAKNHIQTGSPLLLSKTVRVTI